MLSQTNFDPSEEANARNMYLLKNTKGSIPSYSLWDEYSVGNPENWNKWWLNINKEKKIKKNRKNRKK